MAASSWAAVATWWTPCRRSRPRAVKMLTENRTTPTTTILTYVLPQHGTPPTAYRSFTFHWPPGRSGALAYNKFRFVSGRIARLQGLNVLCNPSSETRYPRRYR